MADDPRLVPTVGTRTSDSGAADRAIELWSDGEVVQHLRDTEAEACAIAHRWVAEFLTG